MNDKKRAKYVKELQNIRKQAFTDSKEMQQLRRSDYRYDSVIDLKNKAQKILDEIKGAK